MAIVTTITAIVGIDGKLGFFARAEFADEILGEWGDRGEATGGLVLALENETGVIYPELRDMRDEAIDQYSKFRNALPWNKASAAKWYHEDVQKLANAIETEARAHQESGLFGGPLDFFLGVDIKTLLFAGIAIVCIMLTLSFILGRKRKRR